MSSNFFSGACSSPRELGSRAGSLFRPALNVLAVVAAVCAALGFVTAVGFVGGIIFGHIALVQIKSSKGRQAGRRLALAAVIVSWIPVTLVLLVFGVLFLIGLAASPHQ